MFTAQFFYFFQGAEISEPSGSGHILGRQLWDLLPGQPGLPESQLEDDHEHLQLDPDHLVQHAPKVGI